MTHPWHDISPGQDVPNEVIAIIEVPKDSKLKYELDKETGLMKLDRVLYSAVHYPGDYGFIPQTYWDDNDPLDILILSNFPVYPRTIVRARPIGVLHMSDGNERDDKIIAVHATDPRFNRYKKISDVPDHILLEIKHFFETYKLLQNKKVKVLSIKNVTVARQDIRKGIENYKKKFGGNNVQS
jgi:inorganic pyrophosphatase